MKYPVPASTIVRAGVAAVGKGSRDHRAWARKILANQRLYPNISVEFAREALGIVSLPHDTEADDERAAIQTEGRYGE